MDGAAIKVIYQTAGGGNNNLGPLLQFPQLSIDSLAAVNCCYPDFRPVSGQRSQFIVITHNPRTMEAMDLLHGVTMQDAGVSQRISVELRDAQEMSKQKSAQAPAQPREDIAEVAGGE